MISNKRGEKFFIDTEIQAIKELHWTDVKRNSLVIPKWTKGFIKTIDSTGVNILFNNFKNEFHSDAENIELVKSEVKLPRRKIPKLIDTKTYLALNGLKIYKNRKAGEFTPAKQKFILDRTDPNLEAIFYSVSDDKPCLLIGETGTGKTSLVRYLASLTNKQYRRINLNGQTNTDDLVGKWIIKDGSMRWLDGVLIEAMRKGYWLVLDELNSALPEVLFLLQSLLDDDKFVVLPEKNGEIVRPHKNFRLFATMNPSSSGNYVGTNELNRALMSRFPIVAKYQFMTATLEKKVLALHSDLASEKVDQLLEATKLIRQAYKEGSTGFPLSTRDLIQFVQMLDKFNFATALEFAILNKTQAESESKFVKDVFATTGLIK